MSVLWVSDVLLLNIKLAEENTEEFYLKLWVPCKIHAKDEKYTLMEGQKIICHNQR